MKSKICFCIIFTGILLSPKIHWAQQRSLNDMRSITEKIQLPRFKTDTFNIANYGAKADGITLNTASIQSAMEACSKNGGGVVLIPDGLWLTGPIVFKNNINLHLTRGALLLFSKDFDQYPLIATYFEGLQAVRCQSPISAKKVENIAITGNGIINSNGDAWRYVKKGKLTESAWKKLNLSGGVLNSDKNVWYPSQKSLLGDTEKENDIVSNRKTLSDYEPVKDYLRPNMLSFIECKRILLQGVTFENSPAWGLHPLLCEDLTVQNIQVRNPSYAQNGDGIDIESCKNVLVENSTFATGDDAICIKSGKNEQGRKRGVATENVVIRNCVVYEAHGGFVIGSEMSGGVRDIYVTNCTFIGTDIGLRFKTGRGRGGIVENIFVSDIKMKDIIGEAVKFDMYYGRENRNTTDARFPVNEGTPQFRNFYISNVYCNGSERAMSIRGLPEMSIKNISFDNVIIQAENGIDCTDADSLYFSNMELMIKNNNPVISLGDSKNILLSNVKGGKTAEKFLSISGKSSRNIRVTKNTVPDLKNKIHFSNGAEKKSLLIR